MSQIPWFQIKGSTLLRVITCQSRKPDIFRIQGSSKIFFCTSNFFCYWKHSDLFLRTKEKQFLTLIFISYEKKRWKNTYLSLHCIFVGILYGEEMQLSIIKLKLIVWRKPKVTVSNKTNIPIISIIIIIIITMKVGKENIFLEF